MAAIFLLTASISLFGGLPILRPHDPFRGGEQLFGSKNSFSLTRNRQQRCVSLTEPFKTNLRFRLFFWPFCPKATHKIKKVYSFFFSVCVNLRTRIRFIGKSPGRSPLRRHRDDRRVRRVFDGRQSPRRRWCFTFQWANPAILRRGFNWPSVFTFGTWTPAASIAVCGDWLWKAFLCSSSAFRFPTTPCTSPKTSSRWRWRPRRRSHEKKDTS